MPDTSEKWERNQTDVRGDGRVMIYQRPRRDGSVNPTWHMRLLLPNKSGYFKSSTRTLSETDAIRIALNKFDEFQVRALSGGALRKILFSKTVLEWKKDFTNSRPKARKTEYVNADIDRMSNYPLTFFGEVCGDLALEEIDEAKIRDFYIWRRQNSFRDGKQFIPGDDTLRKEMNLVKSLLKYALRKKYISNIPDLPKPETAGENRRPAFSKTEWTKLYTAARKWVKGAENHRPTHRDRFYLQHIVLISMNSGIRIGEAREIRWGNIRTLKTSEGDQVILSVLVKTDERDVVCNPNTNRYLERLYDYRREELNRDPDPSEPIFCHRDGRAIGSIKKSFASLLNFAGLTYNSRGQKRTPYSLRHSYATFRLEEVSVYFLAKNMGTSVEMIERFYGQTKTKEQAVAMTKGLPRAEETKEAKTRSYPFKA